MALRVLYQVETGGQPLSGALEGAIEHVRMPLERLLTQYCSQARASIDAEAGMRSSGQTTLRTRRIRHVSRQIAAEVDRCADAVRALGAQVVTCSPTESSGRAATKVPGIAEESLNIVTAIALRDPALASATSNMPEMAANAVSRIDRSFRRQIASSETAALLLCRLVRGVTEHRAEIDALLEAHAIGWPLERQSAVDRNILRLGAFEMQWSSDVPAAVAIVEALEIARKYSSDDAARFVNGVLGAMAAAADPGTGPDEGDAQ